MEDIDNPHYKTYIKKIQSKIYDRLKTTNKKINIPQPNDSYQYNTDPPQDGKRCGVIFIEIYKKLSNWTKYNNTKFNTSNLNWRSDNHEKHMINNYHHDDTIISFLVVKGKTSNIWSFAKGRMKNETETEEECALREVYEETGIKFDTLKFMPKIYIGKNVYFICRTNKREFSKFTIHDNYEIGEVGWKTIYELKRNKSNKDVRAVLKYPHRILPHHIFNNIKI
jgi:ADP-ribose pyrophosphatase YjhB (NUDIX family)